MRLTQKQKTIIKKVIKYYNYIILNEVAIREMLYSPWAPTTARYISNSKKEEKIRTILDYLEYGQSRWKEDRLRDLVDRYAYAFGYEPKRTTKKHKK